jgi:uncharacterized protein (DUF58 family)
MNEGSAINELAPERRLRRLELAVTRRLDGLVHGSSLGLLPGLGSEPAGSREYRPGEDEVRRMDWSVTARTTVPHVRTVEADRELATWVLVDATASMDFGTAEFEKRELATAAAAAVGFLTAGAGNRLGAHLLTPDGVRRFPARGGRTHLLGILRTLLTVPRATDTAPLADAIDGLHRAVPRCGLMVVVSDFLDGLDEDGLGPAAPAWEQPLRRLATRHQVLAVHVGDPREHELPEPGQLRRPARQRARRGRRGEHRHRHPRGRRLDRHRVRRADRAGPAGGRDHHRPWIVDRCGYSWWRTKRTWPKACGSAWPGPGTPSTSPATRPRRTNG